MAKIIKLPSGAYRSQPMVGGVRISITDPDKNKVKLLVSQFEAGQKNLAVGNISVKEAIREYIDDKTPNLSPATVREYDQILRNHFENDFGNRKIKTITQSDIQRFVNRIDLAPKTVRNIFALMRSSFEYGGFESTGRISLPKKKENKYNVPTNDQINKLINGADPDLRIAILLAAFGTLRRSEIAALEWNDIDFENCTVSISKAAVLDTNNHVQIKEPKTRKSNRIVMLPKFVIEEIKKRDGIVCGITPPMITNRFLRMKKKIGIDVRFHDLRHYSASIMHAIGIPDQYIMERGGWKSDRVLKSVYRNEISDISQQMNAKINDYFSEAFAREFAHDH